MQAIILAAKQDKRTFPLTVTRPKALLKVMNKSILEHTLDRLIGLVEEVIIAVEFKKEMIIEKLGSSYKGLSLKYLEVEELRLTGKALTEPASGIENRFMLLTADYLYQRSDLEECLKHDKSILLGKAENIADKPGNEILASALAAYSREGEIYTAPATKWLPIIYPWNLLEANETYLSRIEADIAGTVEPYATLKGKIIIGKGTIVKNGAYIEGPVIIGENCKIGPNCFIRPFTAIGDHCAIGNAVEIKNSIIGDYVHVGHLSYFGDSIIGERVNIGAGNISANLRHDNRPVMSVLNGEKIDTKRRKMGVIIGDDVHTGIHNSFYPGRKIWPNLTTLPGEIISSDKIAD